MGDQKHSTESSAIYQGTVMHRRIKPKKHKFKYNVFSLLIDLNELKFLDQNIKGFNYNRFGLLSFYNKDYGLGSKEPLQTWVTAVLHKAGLSIEGGCIKLLCYPRILGYTFNPIANYFCYNSDGALIAILVEVSNTFHEKHCYLINTHNQKAIVRHSQKKCLYVSPFIDMEMTYNFRIVPPSEIISISINESDSIGKLLYASFSGKRTPLRKWSVIISLLKYPLMTLKIIAAIHWEAFRLWRKGVPLVHHPTPPKYFVSYNNKPL